MANYKVVDADKLDSDLKGLANKIRAKTNTEEEIDFPEGFDTALDNVGEDLDTEIAEQEALIAELKEKLANKASGGSGGGSAPSVKEKDVNFYDYDGTLLHSYTVEEAQALSELPELPTQEGLICQGWNWSLDDIKAHNRAVDVGATYITDDGKTRLYIKIAAEGRMDVPLYFSQTVANGVTIDWGDGSATETLSGTGNVNTTHTYASIGEYMITLDPVDGCVLGLGHASSSYCVMGSKENNGKVYCNMLQKVEIGNGVTRIRNYSLQHCYSLVSVVIPNSVTSIEGYAFNECYSLASIVIPYGTTQISGQAFLRCYSLGSVVLSNSITIMSGMSTYSYCYSLARIIIPNSITEIGNSMFQYCSSLASIDIHDNITVITGYAFSKCYSLARVAIPSAIIRILASTFDDCGGIKTYDFTRHTTVPTLVSTSAFAGIPSDCEIRVPAALYDEWIAATNWSTYADNIVAV